MPPDKGGRRLAIPSDLERTPSEAGVLTLYDASDQVLRIAGVPDLRRGLTGVLREPDTAVASSFSFELEPLYTQRETELLAQFTREHGHLPRGNDLEDDLFVSDESV
ncbi:MAG: hypothetical protein A2W26_01415 [Acidobacteria bacterium RBG_16_64_8]|nr:MAG: hypothetical protein A2W26_01415 [Acidobacteria bacterium RBG_16_64_8]